MKAAGKKASTTGFFPLKSESFTGAPDGMDGSVKSGAMSPAFKCVLGGAAWGNSAEAKTPASVSNVRPLTVASLTDPGARVNGNAGRQVFLHTPEALCGVQPAGFEQ